MKDLSSLAAHCTSDKLTIQQIVVSPWILHVLRSGLLWEQFCQSGPYCAGTAHFPHPGWELGYPGPHVPGLHGPVSSWKLLFPWVRCLNHCTFVLCLYRNRNTEAFDMYVGLVDLNVAGNHTQWFEVNRVIIHPTYELYHPVGGDIALVQLKTRIVFSDSVLPICIAPPDLTLWNLSCWATGWGSISRKGKKTKCRVEPFIGACGRDDGFITLPERMFCPLRGCKYLRTGIFIHQSLYVSVSVELCFIPGWLCCIQRSTYIYFECETYILYTKSTNFQHSCS